MAQRIYGEIKVEAKSGFFYLICTSSIDGKKMERHRSPAFKHRINAETDIANKRWKSFLREKKKRGSQVPFIPHDPVPNDEIGVIGNPALAVIMIEEVAERQDAMVIVPPVENIAEKVPIRFLSRWSIWVYHQAKMRHGEEKVPISMSVTEFLDLRAGFWTHVPHRNDSKYRRSEKYGFCWRVFHGHMLQNLGGLKLSDEQKTHYLLTIVNMRNASWTAQKVVEEVVKMNEKSREKLVVNSMEPNTALLKAKFYPSEQNNLPEGQVTKNIKRQLKRKINCLNVEKEKNKEGNDHLKELATGERVTFKITRGDSVQVAAGKLLDHAMDTAFVNMETQKKALERGQKSASYVCRENRLTEKQQQLFETNKRDIVREIIVGLARDSRADHVIKVSLLEKMRGTVSSEAISQEIDKKGGMNLAGLRRLRVLTYVSGFGSIYPSTYAVRGEREKLAFISRENFGHIVIKTSISRANLATTVEEPRCSTVDGKMMLKTMVETIYRSQWHNVPLDKRPKHLEIILTGDGTSLHKKVFNAVCLSVPGNQDPDKLFGIGLYIGKETLTAIHHNFGDLYRYFDSFNRDNVFFTLSDGSRIQLKITYTGDNKNAMFLISDTENHYSASSNYFCPYCNCCGQEKYHFRMACYICCNEEIPQAFYDSIPPRFPGHGFTGAKQSDAFATSYLANCQGTIIDNSVTRVFAQADGYAHSYQQRKDIKIKEEKFSLLLEATENAKIPTKCSAILSEEQMDVLEVPAGLDPDTVEILVHLPAIVPNIVPAVLIGSTDTIATMHMRGGGRGGKKNTAQGKAQLSQGTSITAAAMNISAQGTQDAELKTIAGINDRLQGMGKKIVCRCFPMTYVGVMPIKIHDSQRFVKYPACHDTVTFKELKQFYKDYHIPGYIEKLKKDQLFALYQIWFRENFVRTTVPDPTNDQDWAFIGFADETRITSNLKMRFQRDDVLDILLTEEQEKLRSGFRKEYSNWTLSEGLYGHTELHAARSLLQQCLLLEENVQMHERVKNPLCQNPQDMLSDNLHLGIRVPECYKKLLFQKGIFDRTDLTKQQKIAMADELMSKVNDVLSCSYDSSGALTYTLKQDSMKCELSSITADRYSEMFAEKNIDSYLDILFPKGSASRENSKHTLSFTNNNGIVCYPTFENWSTLLISWSRLVAILDRPLEYGCFTKDDMWGIHYYCGKLSEAFHVSFGEHLGSYGHFLSANHIFEMAALYGNFTARTQQAMESFQGTNKSFFMHNTNHKCNANKDGTVVTSLADTFMGFYGRRNVHLCKQAYFPWFLEEEKKYVALHPTRQSTTASSGNIQLNDVIDTRMMEADDEMNEANDKEEEITADCLDFLENELSNAPFAIMRAVIENTNCDTV